MSQKIKPDNIFEYDKGNTTIKRIILNDKLKILKPQNILNDEDQTVMILVYLPEKTIRTIKHGKKILKTETFANSAYLIQHKPSVQFPIKKYKIPYDAPELEQNFRVDVLPEWNDVRWDPKDIDKWRHEKTPTEPTKVFELMLATAKKYLDFSDEEDYIYFVLWNIGTYFYRLFNAYPYNDYTGTKRAGKTKSLDYQKHVCFNAIMSPDMSGSSIFRIIQGLGATVLLDETEQFRNRKNDNAQQIRTLLLQGFMKDQFAIRSASKDKDFTPTLFDLYSPKSLAHINSFDDVLADRCIPQIMKRSTNRKISDTWPEEKDHSFQQIRNLCYRLFLDYANEIYKLKENTVNLLSVSGRELLSWTPLITLALFFENHGLSGLVKAIQTKVTTSSAERQLQDEQDNYDYKIVEFLDRIGIEVAEQVEKNPKGWITISKLYEHLISDSKEFGINVEWFSRNKLSNTLRRLGLKNEKKAEGISWLVTRQSIAEVKQMLGIQDAAETAKSAETAGSDTNETATLEAFAIPAENSKNE